MTGFVECSGAPRDVGLDQGRACRATLSDRFAALPWPDAVRLRLGLLDGDRARLARDLARHFPHLYESIAGLAVGAGVPEAFAVSQIAAELATGEAPTAAQAGESAWLARRLPGPRLVRRSRPEGLFASVELTRPWLPSVLLGVNERGLAVAVAESTLAEAGCAAPAALLAQDCLERFEALDAALEWCAGRPGGGRARIFLGDAAGEVAGIELGEGRPRVLRPADGLLVCGSDGAEMAKSLRDAPPWVAPDDDVARVDTGERRLLIGGASFSL